MKCKWCDTDMSAIGMSFANGWECPSCAHQKPEIASAKMYGNYEQALIFQCECDNCKSFRADQAAFGLRLIVGDQS